MKFGFDRTIELNGCKFIEEYAKERWLFFSLRVFFYFALQFAL